MEDDDETIPLDKLLSASVLGLEGKLEAEEAAVELERCKKVFAGNMLKYMEKYNLTRRGLVERTDLNMDTINMFLDGCYKPQPETLERFAEILKCDVGDLWPENKYGV